MGLDDPRSRVIPERHHKTAVNGRSQYITHAKLLWACREALDRWRPKNHYLGEVRATVPRRSAKVGEGSETLKPFHPDPVGGFISFLYLSMKTLIYGSLTRQALV